MLQFQQIPAEGDSMWVLDDLRLICHPVKRLFFISPEGNSTRGDHAHLDCWQTLMCIKGKILITVDDGINKQIIDLSSYGQALTNFGRNEEALSYVNKAIELDPQSKRNYEGFFPLLYIALKDWENAITWLNTAHERSPHSRYFGWKAAVYGKMNDLDSAKENLSSFIKERPEIKTLEDYEKVAPTIIKDTLLEGLKIAGLK